MVRHFAVAALLAGFCAVLAGCGGGGGAPDGAKVSFTIRWPATSPAGVAPAMIPEGTSSVTVALSNAAGPIGSQTVTYEPGGPTTTSVTFTDVPVGTVKVTATAYASSDGTGTPLASGSISIAVTASSNNRATLVMAGPIYTLEVVPASPTVAVGATDQLTVTARDEEGNLILLAPGSLSYVPLPSGRVTVSTHGLVTGVAPGDVDITVTEADSGKNAVAHLTVTSTGTAAPSLLQAVLAEDSNGTTPYIRLSIQTSSEARAVTHGWLIFRSTSPSVLPTADNLIDVVEAVNLNSYADSPQVRNDLVFEMSFDYSNGSSPQTANMSAEWNDPALVPGTQYYYRVQRFMEPAGGGGVVVGQAPVTPTLYVDPTNALSDPSLVSGPVTYLLPSALTSPANGASNVNSANVQFSWDSVAGADDYVVQVFPATDSSGTGTPLVQSAVIHNTGSGTMSTSILNALSNTSMYYWRLGARQSNDPAYPVFVPTGGQGWLYSAMRSFTTVGVPGP
jgi:hypothetical protein